MYARTECLGEGIAFTWANWLLSVNATTGADVIEQNAGCKPDPRRILQIIIRARRQTVSNLIKPNNGFSKSANGFRHHQPASLLIKKKSLPDLSLQSKHFSSTSRRVIRLQQRCNLDSHRDDAYTSFWTQAAISCTARCRFCERETRCPLQLRIACCNFQQRPSIEFANWRGRWRRPCVECAFNSYTSNDLTVC
jgi:hypothetical protein